MSNDGDKKALECINGLIIKLLHVSAYCQEALACNRQVCLDCEELLLPWPSNILPSQNDHTSVSTGSTTLVSDDSSSCHPSLLPSSNSTYVDGHSSVILPSSLEKVLTKARQVRDVGVNGGCNNVSRSLNTSTLNKNTATTSKKKELTSATKGVSITTTITPTVSKRISTSHDASGRKSAHARLTGGVSSKASVNRGSNLSRQLDVENCKHDSKASIASEIASTKHSDTTVPRSSAAETVRLQDVREFAMPTEYHVVLLERAKYLKSIVTSVHDHNSSSSGPNAFLSSVNDRASARHFLEHEEIIVRMKAVATCMQATLTSIRDIVKEEEVTRKHRQEKPSNAEFKHECISHAIFGFGNDLLDISEKLLETDNIITSQNMQEHAQCTADAVIQTLIQAKSRDEDRKENHISEKKKMFASGDRGNHDDIGLDIWLPSCWLDESWSDDSEGHMTTLLRNGVGKTAKQQNRITYLSLKELEAWCSAQHTLQSTIISLQVETLSQTLLALLVHQTCSDNDQGSVRLQSGSIVATSMHRTLQTLLRTSTQRMNTSTFVDAESLRELRLSFSTVSTSK